MPEWASGNIFIRSHQLNRGDRIDGHQHRFDHTSIVFTGAVHIRACYRYRQFRCPACAQTWESRHLEAAQCPRCGQASALPLLPESQRDELLAERDLHAAQFVLIKADVEHEIVALEDRTEFWCIYAHRDAQGQVTQDWDGWTDAYT